MKWIIEQAQLKMIEIPFDKTVAKTRLTTHEGRDIYMNVWTQNADKIPENAIAMRLENGNYIFGVLTQHD